jgi:hypothetical protein
LIWIWVSFVVREISVMRIIAPELSRLRRDLHGLQ